MKIHNPINTGFFFHDSFTEGWTKKKWVLNLIPLGGCISVVYEIGAACLFPKDHTAKISEDFFKSPFQTAVKKTAQCLWAPVVTCAVLKVVCFIVEACWNRYSPPANDRFRGENPAMSLQDKNSFILTNKKKENSFIALQAIDPSSLPNEIVFHIFSYLNLSELGASRRVSSEWNKHASIPHLWQSAVYHEFAFNSRDWAEWDKDLVKGVDIEKERRSLPENIAEELRNSAFPGKIIKKTHLLVRMPKGLTISKLEEFAKKHFKTFSPHLSSEIAVNVCDELKYKPASEPTWMLMTKTTLKEDDDNKNYAEKKELVANLAKKTRLPYQVPTTLEAATCVLVRFCHEKYSGFDKNFSFSTYCQESIEDRQMYVWGCPAKSLYAICPGGIPLDGMVAFRKF